MLDEKRNGLDPESGLLRRSLPALVSKTLDERGVPEDDVLIATDTDLDIVGEYSERWLVVTRQMILVFLVDEEEDEALVVREVNIGDIETARTDTRVGSGFLEVKQDGVFEEIVRFSNRNAEKFARAVGRIRSLAEGKQVDIEEEKEPEKGRCQKCGLPLVDRSMRVCPKCVKRGTVFVRFVMHTRQFWPAGALALCVVVLFNLIQLLPPQFTRVLVDSVLKQDPEAPPRWFGVVASVFGVETRREQLYLLVGGLVVVVLTSQIIAGIRETLAVWIQHRLGFDLRQQVFRKLEDMAVRYHDSHSVGQLMTRCSQDVEALQGFINQVTSGFVSQFIMVFGVAIAMFLTNTRLALWATVPAPFVMACTVIYYRRIVPLWRKYWSSRSTLNNVLHSALNGIRVVKAFAQEEREGRRFADYSGRFRDAGLGVGFKAARFYPMVGFIFQLGSFGIWMFGGLAVLDESLSLGELIAFLAYLGMFYAPLNGLTQMSTWFTQFTTQAHRVFEILDEQSEIEEAGDAVEVEIQGAITFDNVTFGYDPHIPVLHDVSFRVSPGEMVGVVGHSGSGKSTTVNLIMRFYDPTEGQITVDNIPIQRIKKLCLRRQVGLVPQDPHLFRGSIADNITYGNPRVAPEQVLNAALAANAHMFITRIHDGYDTRLGEQGSGLSGGERQRVAIARALLHNPRVLILDEATSSVDTIAEREIQKALEALSTGRTTVAIAHRLSTLRNCDRILVFEEGYIREQGTHEELMNLDGIYKKLVEIQTQLTSDSMGQVDQFKELHHLDKDPVQARAEKEEARRRLDVPHIKYLDPKKLHVHAMDEGGLHVTYGTDVYEHVHAYRCFPISQPSEFIALWTGSSALEHREIGVVRRLKELAPSSRLSVEHELAKRYFIHYISKISAIREELGFLEWKVETDKGDMEFLTRRFDRNTVVEGPGNARIIFDLDNNRYEIENLDALDDPSLALFQKHIYW